LKLISVSGINSLTISSSTINASPLIRAVPTTKSFRNLRSGCRGLKWRYIAELRALAHLKWTLMRWSSIVATTANVFLAMKNPYSKSLESLMFISLSSAAIYSSSIFLLLTSNFARNPYFW